MFKRRIRPGVLALIIIAVVLLIFIYAPILTLREIRTSGLQFLTNDDIVRICNTPYGTPLFSLETDDISKRLLSDLRIEDAVVRRSLPSYLDITITERLPIATIATDNYYLAIDKKGVVIDAYNTPKYSQIPNIRGMNLKNVFIGDEMTDESAKRILAFLEALDPKYLKEFKELEYRNDTIIGETVTGIVIRLGDLSNIESKARMTENFLEDIKQSPISAEYVDFKYDAPFMKMKEEIKNEDN